MKHIKTKEQARQYAIKYQQMMSENNLSYGEIVQFENKLSKLAKKFNLIKEFKEKGYNTREYFIDVWEKDKNGASYPLAEINIDEFYFNHYCE